jgi:hypothetical protein
MTAPDRKSKFGSGFPVRILTEHLKELVYHVVCGRCAYSARSSGEAELVFLSGTFGWSEGRSASR